MLLIFHNDHLEHEKLAPSCGVRRRFLPSPIRKQPVQVSEHAAPGARCGGAQEVEENWTMSMMVPLAVTALPAIE
jgi:hypothetical protein